MSHAPHEQSQRGRGGERLWVWTPRKQPPLRILGAAALALLLALWPVGAALAHPLGNFTVNRYSRIELSPDQVRVRYVVDLAEIPTFQAMASLDANGDGQVTDAEKDAFASRTLGEAARNLHLTLEETSIPLRVVSRALELLPGQAGLRTLRLEAWLEAPGAAEIVARVAQRGQARGARLDYHDDNDPERVGWREILVQTAGGVSVEAPGGGTVPTTDVSNELRTYPQDMLASPLDVRQVRLSVVPAGAAAADGLAGALMGAAAAGGLAGAPMGAAAADGLAGAPASAARAGMRAAPGPSLSRQSDGFTEVLARTASAPLTPPLVVVALLSAVVLGALHSMSPGHGKTIVGAYLVGARGTARHALFLGLTVTAVHTAGVFALGLATLFASRYVVPEQVYPWLSLLSGMLVLALGCSLMWARARAAGWRPRLHALPGPLPPAVPAHSHGSGTHTHALPGADGSPVTWRSLLALGISGGLLPCPSALVVMLGAIALHRVAFGLLLIVFFSLGLAGTLVALGLLMVYSGRIAGRLRLLDRVGAGGAVRLATVVRGLPVASAAVVALAGLALSAEAARQLDLSRLWTGMAALGEAVGGSLAAVHNGAPALLATALLLGMRHGVDWDHLAAIADITSAGQNPERPDGSGLAVATSGRSAGSAAMVIVAAQARPMAWFLGGLALAQQELRLLWLGTLYALGHACVVGILGIAALYFAAVLPAWIDPIMERVVGITLLALGAAVVYSLVRYWRGEGEFRLQSRWMLVFTGVRLGWCRLQAWLHGHRHDGGFHIHRIDQYGPRAAFGVGVIHGIGAETGTQVLLIAAVGGASSQGLGGGMLLAFVGGLLISNTLIALLTSTGFMTSSRAKVLYVAAGCVAAVFSVVVGSLFVMGWSSRLPDLPMMMEQLAGHLPV